MKYYSCKEIVTEWLEKNGYDGLCQEDYECACELSDLMPCGETWPTCLAGYKKKDETGEYDFTITPGKNPDAKEQTSVSHPKKKG